MANSVKKFFITGATHGIGKATAELFCQKGWQVFGISLNAEDNRGKEMSERFPSFCYRRADVRNEAEISALLREIGPIDAAFNNAGIGKVQENIENESIDGAREVVETNLFGTLICMKHELKNMRQGCVVNNASIAAFKSGTGADASYAAAKAGILRLTAEAAVCPAYLSRISFFCLAPGYVRTRMTASDKDKASQLLRKEMRCPEEVARLVYKIVEDREAFTSGQCFNIDGGEFLR